MNFGTGRGEYIQALDDLGPLVIVSGASFSRDGCASSRTLEDDFNRGVALSGA